MTSHGALLWVVNNAQLNFKVYGKNKQQCVLSYGAFIPLLPDRCGHKIHKSKGDRQCDIGQQENVCLFCSYVFSVRTVQADRGINALLKYGKHI